MGNKLIGGHLLMVNDYLRNNIVASDMAMRRMWNPITGTSTIIGRSDTIPAAISPDGKLAIVGSTVTPFMRVVDFEAETWVTPIATLPSNVPYAIRFNNAFSEFVVGFSASPFIYRYAYPSFALLATFPVGPASRVNGVAYNGTDTKLVVALQNAPYLEVYDLVSNTKESWAPTASPPAAEVLCVAFTTAGDKIAMGALLTASQRLRVYEYPSGVPIHIDTGTNDVYVTRFSPDDTKLALITAGTTGASSYPKLQIYNTTTWARTDLPMPSYIFDGTSGYGDIKWIDNRFVWFHFEGGDLIIDTSDNSLVKWAGNFTNNVGGGDLSPLTVVRKIAGTVTDGAAGALERVVRAFDTATGLFIGEGTSDPVTGEFEFYVLSAEICTVYALGQGGELAKIYDGVSPAVV